MNLLTRTLGIYFSLTMYICTTLIALQYTTATHVHLTQVLHVWIMSHSPQEGEISAVHGNSLWLYTPQFFRWCLFVLSLTFHTVL